MSNRKFWFDGQFGFNPNAYNSGSGFTGSMTGSMTGSFKGIGTDLTGLSIDWGSVTSKPVGLVSGSTNSGSFTGSFTGSFNGAAAPLTISNKSSAYSLTNSDVNKQIRVTGTTTITLPAALTWDEADGCEVVNVGSNTVTVATTSPVIINNDPSDVVLAAYEGIVLMKLASNIYLGTGNQTSGGGVV